jgi:tetratricopeptide (TPR) repeat protein/TolB-like protein
MNDQIISHYRIHEKLGAGGMGVVYKAEDIRLGRQVALKFLPDSAVRDPRALERFKREARTASALDHPNICTIYEIDEDQGRPFIAMQLLEGQTLQKRIGENPVPLGTLLEWALQITDALQAAHAKGVMHRDIKPANIFITERNQAKILDFGLAKLTATEVTNSADATLSSTGPLTHTGAAIGTVAYMSPEQARGEQLDARTDLFSFGVLLYEMATGKQAFSGPTWAVTVHAILGQAPMSLNESMPGLPQRLQGIIDKALMKNRDLRYQTAAEMHGDLLQLKKDFEAGKSLKTVRTATTWSAKRKFRLALATCLAVVVVVAAVWGPRVFRRLAASATAVPGSVAPTRKSVAVLPFAAVDGDPKLTAFGKGLLDDVAAKLSQLSANHDLQIVPARTLEESKVTTLADANKEFGVNLGLAVSLKQDNDLVRAAYNLTDAVTGKNLAGDTITAPVSDPFAIEDKLTTGVASALQIPLRTEEQKALVEHATNLPEAFQYYVQGIGYLRSGRRDPESMTSAEILFNQALKLDPNFGRAQAALGEVFWQRYDVTKQKRWVAPAQQACDKAIQLANAGAEGHMCLGLLENTTGQYEKAAEQFQQAAQLEPSNEQSYVNLAASYERLNQPEKAEEVYKRVIEIRPRESSGYSYLGAFYFGQAQYEKAQAMFEKAIALTPDSYLNYTNLGAVLLYEGKYEESTRAFEKSISIRPTSAAYANAAIAFFDLHRFPDAIRENLAAIKLDDSDYQTWEVLGDSYYYSGNVPAAGESYRKALPLAEQQLKLNPRDAGILASLAYYNSMLGDRKQALALLDRALQLGHGDKELLFKAAQVYNQLHETGPTLEFLSKAFAAGYSRSVVGAAATFDNLHDNPRYQALMKEK